MRDVLPITAILVFWAIAFSVLLAGCSTIGKAPYYRGQVVAIDTQAQVISIVEPISYYRVPVCRYNGNPEADGYYGCADSKQQ